ncbi:hypothetical protein Btru_002243 [Bulinus truncatus]|nr:hypothetical protein Btru_002243 [Bulinus truncatus]
MGNTNSQNKSALRKSQSVPDTQKLSPDAPVLFSKEKSLSQQRLNHNQPKPVKPNKAGGKKQKHHPDNLPQLPQTEAVFLPEFPLRGDLEELDFEVIDVIAKGAFGNVIKVQREDQKRFYAMKVLDKEQILQEGAVRQCKEEAAIQSFVGDHPFIVKAHEYWQSKRFLYIVLDYIPHGDMFTLWTFHGAFPENLVRLYIAEISMVIDYLHNTSVIYRDVKMENILFDPKGHIQLTDFGLAKWLQGGAETRTVCGTLQYMAPEVLSVYPYGHAADWWSVGILMYAMLAGRYPVDGADTHTNMAQKVFECDYLLPSHISDSAQDVINRFLTKSPHKRLCNLDVIQDLHFFQDLYFPDLIDGKVNPINVVPEDFFPMTGESWAPHVITQEEQNYFDQFDDVNEKFGDQGGVSYAGHQLRHHADQYRPPSIAQTMEDQPYRKRSYSQPMQVLYNEYRRESISRPAEAGPSMPQRRQNDPDGNYPFSLPAPEEDQSSEHRYPKPSSVSQPQAQRQSVKLSQPYAGQRPEALDTTYGHQTAYKPLPQNVGSSGHLSSPYNGSAIDSPSLHSSDNSDIVGYRPYGLASPNDSDRVGYFTGHGGAGPSAAQGEDNQKVVSNTSLNRRSNSGDGLISTNPPSNYSPASLTNNLHSVNGYASNNYKTVDSAPTITLKSPGFGTISSGYNQPVSGGLSHSDYAQQGSRFSSTMAGPTVQAVNSQPSMGMQNSHLDMVTNRISSSDQAFITVDSPPVVKLPTQAIQYDPDANHLPAQSKPNPYLHDLNTLTAKKDVYNQDFRKQAQTGSVGQNVHSLSNPTSLPYPNNESSKQETATRLNSLGQNYHSTPKVPVKPIVPQKPAVSQKPSVPAKPPFPAKPMSAPVRPQPAPRKSLRGQLSNQGNSPTHAGGAAPGQVFNQGDSLGSQNFNNISKSTGVVGSLTRQVSSPATLPAAPTDPAKRNFTDSAGFSDPQTPAIKSPNLEMDSLRWNLPADATPTFL